MDAVLSASPDAGELALATGEASAAAFSVVVVVMALSTSLDVDLVNSIDLADLGGPTAKD